MNGGPIAWRARVLPVSPTRRIHSRTRPDHTSLIRPASFVRESVMDLGIRGRRAIVCASSKGLGRACAEALAEAGVDLVINARDRDKLDQVADEIRSAHDVSVTAVAADIASDEGQEAVLGACPDP